MSKIIWICSRKELDTSIEKKLERISGLITPDNIQPRPPLIRWREKVAFGIMNPSKTLVVEDLSVVMGKTLGEDYNLLEPETSFPDGSFALFRNNESKSEFVSDPAGSRTIWYYFDKDYFIGSTSQRAIINFLRSFEFNQKVIPWMLSTGSIGPELSWDKRIKCLPQDSSVILDKKDWKISEKRKPISFSSSREANRTIEKRFRRALDTTFSEFDIDTTKWMLPLSGGYDSRGILLLLKENRRIDFSKLRTLTWGLKTSLKEKGNDANIASKLAAKVGVSHEFHSTDLSEESFEVTLKRFLINGEGRIDEIAGYLDGFGIWKSLHEQEIHGIVRGDEAFGYKKVSSDMTTRLSLNIGLCSDFSNLKKLKRNGLITEQEMPAYLKRLPNEPLETWRDRLYHQFKLPSVLAALTDLKLSYVELVNPLLSRKILEEVRTQPEPMRTEKSLFRKVVHSLSPNIPYASNGANAKLREVFRREEVVSIFLNVLSSEDAKSLFPEEFLKTVISKIQPREGGNREKGKIHMLKNYLKKRIPRVAYNFLVNKFPSTVTLDYYILAFRIYIVVKMNSIFNEDVDFKENQ